MAVPDDAVMRTCLQGYFRVTLNGKELEPGTVQPSTADSDFVTAAAVCIRQYQFIADPEYQWMRAEINPG